MMNLFCLQKRLSTIIGSWISQSIYSCLKPVHGWAKSFDRGYYRGDRSSILGHSCTILMEIWETKCDTKRRFSTKLGITRTRTRK
jgi:hypothetical protein